MLLSVVTGQTLRLTAGLSRNPLPLAFKEELAATRVLFTHLFLNLPPGTWPIVTSLTLPHSHNKTEYHLLKGWPSNLVYMFITDSYDLLYHH